MFRLIGEMGTLYRGHFALEATSRLAAACAHWSLAARLQGASDAVVDRMGGTRTWFDDPVLAALHAKPAAYDRGRNLMLEVALAEAAAWLEEPGALSR